MNNTATKAAPKTIEIFQNAIKKMNLNDAKKILSGGKSSATNYFKSASYNELIKVISPIVDKGIKNSSVSKYYNKVTNYYSAGRNKISSNSSLIGFAKKIGANKYISKDKPKSLNEHITKSTIDGLFLMIAKKESEIRKNPKEQTTNILKEVFGK